MLRIILRYGLFIFILGSAKSAFSNEPVINTGKSKAYESSGYVYITPKSEAFERFDLDTDDYIDEIKSIFSLRDDRFDGEIENFRPVSLLSTGVISGKLINQVELTEDSRFRRQANGAISFQSEVLGELIIEEMPVYELATAALNPKLWHYSKHDEKFGIGLEKAWSLTKGASIKVGVVDSGVLNHPDLAPNLLKGIDTLNRSISEDGDGLDYDATDAGDWRCDDFLRSSWHGTHVSGTIAAKYNPVTRNSGIAPDAKVVPARSLACGARYILEAVEWLAGLDVIMFDEMGQQIKVESNANPVTVINASIRAITPDDRQYCPSYWKKTLAKLKEKNVTFVAAAGNDNFDARKAEPANCNDAITVAATDWEGKRAYYSNYGLLVDVAAPGGNAKLGGNAMILSTHNDGARVAGNYTWSFMQGTSMAAPHVSGIVALMQSYAEKQGVELTPDRIKEILLETAIPIPAEACPLGCGAGYVDAYNAVLSVTVKDGEVHRERDRREQVPPPENEIPNGDDVKIVKDSFYPLNVSKNYYFEPQTSETLSFESFGNCLSYVDVSEDDNYIGHNSGRSSVDNNLLFERFFEIGKLYKFEVGLFGTSSKCQVKIGG